MLMLVIFSKLYFELIGLKFMINKYETNSIYNNTPRILNSNR